MFMNNIYKGVAALASFALLATACSDNTDYPDGPRPDASGKDVNFSLTTPDQSRTWYGENSWDDNATTAQIYWGIMNESTENMANEEVVIYGTYTGRNKGHYKVGGYDKGSNKATSLTKQGEVGVQWGEDPGAGNTVQFFSVYPALNAEYMNASTATNTFRTMLTPDQSPSGFNMTADELAPTTNPGTARTIIAYPRMNAAVMVATAEAQYGQQSVPLEYHMITNTLEISLNGLADKLINSTKLDYIDIYNIIITSTQDIAGVFNYTPLFCKEC